jgi:hypothetical protein
MALVRLVANRLCICAAHGLFIPLEVRVTEMTVSLGSIMALLSRVFTTRTLVQIIFVLTAVVMMKAMSSHYDFSWASALAQG